jgi:hypothetical protein
MKEVQLPPEKKARLKKKERARFLTGALLISATDVAVTLTEVPG